MAVRPGTLTFFTHFSLFLITYYEGEKNTRRGVELCFEKFFVSLKIEHTDQKLSETASEVIIRILTQRNKTEREEEKHKAIILVPSTIRK
jgi:hypothetical protein